MRRAVLRLFLLGVVPIAVLVVGAHYYVKSARWITTDNAYVKATVVAISAEVTGRVRRVLVGQNTRVKAGELLFSIDSEPFRIAFERTEADLARARSMIEALRADYRQARIERKEADQDIPYYERAFDRQRKLAAKGYASQARHDEAQRNLARARQRARALRQKSLRILAELGGRADLPTEGHPDYLLAKAARDDAELDLRRTMVYAPVAGIVGPVGIDSGEFLAAGTPVMPLVDSAKYWIEANLKETQLTHVSVGQKATIVLDAYPDHILQATVESISPSTGAELSILPPQNASGNWVKVVQRVPVRLALSANRPPITLRTGMTASISIDSGREYSLIELIGTALAWKADVK